MMPQPGCFASFVYPGFIAPQEVTEGLPLSGFVAC